MDWAQAWAQATAKMEYSAASVVAYYRTGQNGPLSFAAAFGIGLPLVGDFAQSAFTAVSGRDFLTDEKVGKLQRGLAIADVGLTVFGGVLGRAGETVVDAAIGGVRATRRATVAAIGFAARNSNRAFQATVCGLAATIHQARGAGRWLSDAATRSAVSGSRIARNWLERVRELAERVPIRGSGDGMVRTWGRKAGAIRLPGRAARGAERAGRSAARSADEIVGELAQSREFTQRVAGRHHLTPRAVGNELPYGHKSLTDLGGQKHSVLQGALDDHLRGVTKTLPDGRVVDMLPRRGNSGTVVQRNFSLAERTAAVDNFYKTFAEGRYYPAYRMELNAARKALLLK